MRRQQKENASKKFVVTATTMSREKVIEAHQLIWPLLYE